MPTHYLENESTGIAPLEVLWKRLDNKHVALH